MPTPEETYLNGVMADLFRELIFESLEAHESGSSIIEVPDTPLRYKVRIENVERDPETDIILVANIHIVFKPL